MVGYSTPAPRRTFLRGLVALPFIGGGLSLVGSPTQAAVPVTREMLVTYADWLAIERHALGYELNGRSAADAMALDLPLFNRNKGWDSMALGSPSGRAAVILSAAGVPLA